VTSLQGFCGVGDEEMVGPVLIVGNKLDAEDMREVEKVSGLGFAAAHGCAFAEVACVGEGVGGVVEMFYKMMVEFYDEGSGIKTKLEAEIKSQNEKQTEIQHYIAAVRRCKK